MSRSGMALCAVLAVVLPSANGRSPLVPLNEQVKHYEQLELPMHKVLRAESPFDDKRHTVAFDLPITLFNRSMVLQMAPATHLFSENAEVHHTAEDGTITVEKLTPHGYYTGAIEGFPLSFAHLHVEADGSVRGMVIKGEEAFHIGPAVDHFDAPQKFDHLVYRESDVEYKKPTMEHEHPHAPLPDVRQPDGRVEAEVSRNRREDGTPVKASPFKRANLNVVPVQGERSVCHIALWADKLFADAYADKSNPGSPAGAVRIMTQRMSTVDAIWKAAGIKPGGIATVEPISFRLEKVLVNQQLGRFIPEGSQDPKPWLERFGEQAGRQPDDSMNWKAVCLAAAFTYHDFSSTLGLAWVGATNDQNANGGICTGQYQSGGVLKSLNTAFTSSLNFEQRQPELQSSLVLAHEIGHNFGALHDRDGGALPADGTFLMYPYAAKGTDGNNNQFSAKSIAEMNGVVADRGGCFLESAIDVCGDFRKSGTEQCDCGKDEAVCATLDPCCDFSTCQLKAGATCSPLDPTSGACCKEDCSAQPTSTVCRELSVCQAQTTCSADGSCPEVANRPTNALCQEGIVDCGDQCTGICAANTCSESICALWGRVPITTAGSGACQVRCGTSAADPAPKSPKDLSADEVTYPLQLTPFRFDSLAGVDKTAVSTDLSANLKPGGSTCEFIASEPTSGLCDSDGNCLAADTEESALDELLEEYAQAKDTVEQYMNEEQAGLKRWNWLVIGGVLLLLCCFTTCHCTNKQKKVRRKSMQEVGKRTKRLEG